MKSTLHQALLELDCASLTDANKSLRVVDAAIVAVNPGHKLVGVARTVRCREDFLTVIEALDQAQAGEVLVIDTQGSRRAVLGELFSLEAERRGLAGIIVDGPVRDVRTLRQLSMPIYARCFCPCAGTTRDLMATQVPITCGGVMVDAGDIVVGDDDGIVVGTVAELEAVLAAARETERLEAIVRGRMAAGQSLLSMLNHGEHVQALARGETSKLKFTLDD